MPTLDSLVVHNSFIRNSIRLKRVEDDEPDWGKLFNTGGIIPKYRSSANSKKVGLDSAVFGVLFGTQWITIVLQLRKRSRLIFYFVNLSATDNQQYGPFIFQIIFKN